MFSAVALAKSPLISRSSPNFPFNIPAIARRYPVQTGSPVPEAEDIPDDLDDAFFTGEDGDAEEKEENPLWKQLLAVEDKKGIAKALWKFIKRMAKGILPGHLIIKGTFGTGDLVWTGYLPAP